MAKPWEQYKDEIYRLYIKEGKTLEQVREHLEAAGFPACKRAYQNQIENWGFKKNVRASDMQTYLEHKKRNLPDTEIPLSEDVLGKITGRKVNRFEKRTAGRNKRERHSDEDDWSGSPISSRSRSSRNESVDAFGQMAPDGQYYAVADEFNSLNQHTTPPLASNYSPNFGEAMRYSPPYMVSDPALLYQTPRTSSAASNISVASNYPSIYPGTGNNDFQGSESRGQPRHTMTTRTAPTYSTDCQQPLISPGNDANTAQQFYRNFYRVVYAGKPDELKYFLTNTIDVNKPDRDGNTAIIFLVKGLHQRIFQPYPAGHENSESDTRNAASKLRLADFNTCLEMLLQTGADATIANNKNEYPLHMVLSTLAGVYEKVPSHAKEDVRHHWMQFMLRLSMAVHTSVSMGRCLPLVQ